jgi:hypothetical protein
MRIAACVAITGDVGAFIDYETGIAVLGKLPRDDCSAETCPDYANSLHLILAFTWSFGL